MPPAGAPLIGNSGWAGPGNVPGFKCCVFSINSSTQVPALAEDQDKNAANMDVQSGPECLTGDIEDPAQNLLDE